ncbi:unnamed protein product, partial [marine sediment metagenome]
MSDIKVARVGQILHQLEVCIVRKRPFSLIRFGDGGVKLLHAYYYNDREQLELISEKEGLPLDNITKIVQLWARYARSANFIDSPGVYFTDRFWGKYKKNLKLASEKTIKR